MKLWNWEEQQASKQAVANPIPAQYQCLPIEIYSICTLYTTYLHNCVSFLVVFIFCAPFMCPTLNIFHSIMCFSLFYTIHKFNPFSLFALFRVMLSIEVCIPEPWCHANEAIKIEYPEWIKKKYIPFVSLCIPLGCVCMYACIVCSSIYIPRKWTSLAKLSSLSLTLTNRIIFTSNMIITNDDVILLVFVCVRVCVFFGRHIFFSFIFSCYSRCTF